jgi:hypothetical protein
MNKIALTVLLVLVFGFAFAYTRNTTEINDMIPIYSAKVTIKQGKENELIKIVKEVANKHSLQLSTDDFSKNNKSATTIRLVSNDVSILLASYISENVYKLAFRVSPRNSEKDGYMKDVFESIEDIFQSNPNVEFERMKVIVYDTRPGKPLHPEKE